MDIIKEFYSNANAENSKYMVDYMRGMFSFLGVNRPKRLELTKEFFKLEKKSGEINWDFVNTCWDLPEREFQYVAQDYLINMKKFLVSDDINRVKKLLINKSWWDTVDLIAQNIVGEIVKLDKNFVETHIKPWAADENMWLRRTAILFQTRYKDETDAELLTEIILLNTGTNEFFINKAIGWAVREYSKINPNWSAEFIDKNKDILHPLSIREGTKKL